MAVSVNVVQEYECLGKMVMNTQLDDLRSLAMIVYMHVYMHYYNGLPSSKRTCFTSQEMVNRPISVQGYCLTKGGMGSTAF